MNFAIDIVRAVGNSVAFFIGNNEAELALLQGTAGQLLGGLGSEGNTRARRCRVGVYKLCAANIFAFAVQLINRGAGFKLAFTVIGDFESDLVCTGIVGDAAEFAIHLTDDVGLFAFGIKSKGLEFNIALRVVQCSVNNSRAIGFTQLEREFLLLQVTRTDFNVQRLVSGQSNLNGLGGIGVGKGCDVDVSVNRLVVASVILAHIVLGISIQFAIAVILDRYHDLINGGVVGDALNGTGVLADEVNVFFCGVKYQRIVSAEGSGLILLVDGSGTVAKSRHGGIAHTAQGKGEGIRVVPSAAQILLYLKQFAGVGLVWCCLVGVYKLGFFVFGVGAAVSNRGFQLIAFGIQRNRDGGGDILGIGDTVGFGTRLLDGIVVNTRLCVGDCTEIGVLFAFVCRCGCAALISGHRGIILRLKGKGELFALIPVVTAGNALAYAQRGRGCTFKFVGEGHLCGGYILPASAVPLIVGGRDFQQFTCCCVCCVSRNNNLNQILLCAVSNSVRITTRHFGKQVIIGFTIVVLVQRVGDICKGDLTVRVVAGAFRIARHGGSGIVCLGGSVLISRFELEVELTGGQLHWLIVAIRVDLRCLNSEFLGVILKGVGKRGSCRICGDVITEYLLNSGGIHCQLASAIVHDGNGHTVEGAVIRNAGDFLGGDNLGDVVLISAGFSEGDTSEVKGNGRSVGGVFRLFQFAHCIACAIRRSNLPFRQRSTRGDSLQLEGKGIVVPPSAALQNLFSPERITVVLRVYRNFLGFIGVGHRNGRGLGRDRAGAVINALQFIAFGQLFFRLRDAIGAAYGQAFDLGNLAVFQGEFIAALDAAFRLFNTFLIGNGVVVRAIRPGAFQRKLHRKGGVSARVQALGGFNRLGNLHAAGGVHGQLAVVAKVQHTHVRGKVPLEVNAAVGSAGFVAAIFLFLIAQLAINGGGQAAFLDALFDVAFAVCIRTNAFSNLIIIINVHWYHIGLGKRFSMRRGVKMQIVQLIVIGFARFKSGDRRTIFGKQRGLLGMIVEAIAFCRDKGSRGLADGFFAICRF